MKSKLQQINLIQTQMYGGGQIPETAYPSVNLVKKAIEENPNKPAKWIVEEYTTTFEGNNWRIRRWNDNEVELFLIASITLTAEVTWGNMYEYTPYFQFNYPITFKSVPMEFAKLNMPMGTILETWIQNTTTVSSRFGVVRPKFLTLPYTGQLYLHVIGYIN